MPQMEKFGYASSRTTVTSAAGSSSRARRAALIPASLPPIMTTCMAGSLLSQGDWTGLSRRTARPTTPAWVMAGYSALMITKASAPPVIWAPM